MERSGVCHDFSSCSKTGQVDVTVQVCMLPCSCLAVLTMFRLIQITETCMGFVELSDGYEGSLSMDGPVSLGNSPLDVHVLQ